jgi:hypothetical protein
MHVQDRRLGKQLFACKVDERIENLINQLAHACVLGEDLRN